MSGQTMAVAKTQSKTSFDYAGFVLRMSGYVVTTLITIILTMTGFWLMEGRNYITRDEAARMIDNENKIIKQILIQQQDNEERLGNILERNTEAIQQLKIEMATLNRTLEYIEGKNEHKNRN